VKKNHDYIHCYRGYWSDGGKCKIRIYREAGRSPMAICSQLQDNENTSVTNMAEYLAAEVVEENSLSTALTWVEHYPERRGAPRIGWRATTFTRWS
jgi:DNA transposition AAA+ family ATPase